MNILLINDRQAEYLWDENRNLTPNNPNIMPFDIENACKEALDIYINEDMPDQWWTVCPAEMVDDPLITQMVIASNWAQVGDETNDVEDDYIKVTPYFYIEILNDLNVTNGEHLAVLAFVQKVKEAMVETFKEHYQLS